MCTKNCDVDWKHRDFSRWVLVTAYKFHIFHITADAAEHECNAMTICALVTII